MRSDPPSLVTSEGKDNRTTRLGEESITSSLSSLKVSSFSALSSRLFAGYSSPSEVSGHRRRRNKRQANRDSVTATPNGYHAFAPQHG